MSDLVFLDGVSYRLTESDAATGPMLYAEPVAAGDVPVVLYGDSWTDEFRTGEPVGWHRHLGELLDVPIDNRAVGGTGYARLWVGTTIPYTVAARPPGPTTRVVVILAGLNDVNVLDTAQVAAGAAATFAAVRNAAPSARLLVLGPQWFNPSPTPLILAHRDAIAVEAARAGAVYVDLIAGRWLMDDPTLIRPNDIHPSAAGHRWLGEAVAPYVRALLP